MTHDKSDAAKYFNAVWALLDKPARSPEEDMQMIHMAHASRALWQEAGGPREWAIGEWQIARVYAALERGEPALFHGQAALALTEDGSLGPFLKGCAHEVLARAFRAAGREAEAIAHHDRAGAMLAGLTDPEERELLAQDLDDSR